MNNISLALKITEFNISHDTITGLFGLEPTEVLFKNNEYFIGPPNNRIRKQYDSNYWEYRVNIKNNNVWIKEIIDTFLQEVLYRNERAFKKLEGKCKFELFIGIWFYGSLDSYHFDIHSLNFLSTNKIEIDIDQFLGT